MITPLDILAVESWVLLATALLLARYYLHRKWQWLDKMNIPHETPSVLNLGNLSDVFRGKDVCNYDNAMKKKHGPIWGAYVWTSPVIVIHDPDMLRQIFIKDFSSFNIRDGQLSKIGGKEINSGLTSVVGEQWKRIRNTMTPAFSTSKLKHMTGIAEWCAGNAVTALYGKVRSCEGVFNCRDFFYRLSLDIVCSAAFSAKVHTLDGTKKEPEIAKRAKALFSGGLLTPGMVLCLIFPPLEKVLDKLDIPLFSWSSIRYFRNLTQSIIKRREENPGESPVDLMQTMLDAKVDESEIHERIERGMTQTEIVGNSMIMIIAGFENTGLTMGYLAYNLAQHPDIQTEVQKEIDEMVKTHGKFDYEGINSLKLLEMCLNETLRLQNPLIRNLRLCTKEISIKGLTIPKGTVIFVPCFALGHDPDYWEDPEEFKPERMRDMTLIDPMVFQPFGAGPRNCIGMRFAILEIKMSLAMILHKFTIAPAKNTPKPPLKLKFKMSMVPNVDYDLKVVPRQVREE